MRLGPSSAVSSLSRLIFFTGHAGVGKTTLSKMAVQQLHVLTGESFFLLDKDTVYSAYSAKVMGLLDIARDNLAIGVNVVICAPFSREVKSRKLFDVQALGMPANTRIHVAWFTIDEELAKLRIISLGDMRDRYKLAHWDEYRTRRFEPKEGEYPEMSIFNNTQFDADKFAELVKKLSSV
jgi:energy-coupling factor transporter ATP-binding protein EcfA2